MPDTIGQIANCIIVDDEPMARDVFTKAAKK
jgi:hypothetical protein